jgi:hypothetical protein
MLGRDGLVVQLPKARVDELISSGAGARWGALSDEALEFVRGVAGKGRVRVR